MNQSIDRPIDLPAARQGHPGRAAAMRWILEMVPVPERVLRVYERRLRDP
jgi:hypothetical protein